MADVAEVTEKFWVTAGSAAALGELCCGLFTTCDHPDHGAILIAVGATLAVTIAGAMVASKGIDNMVSCSIYRQFYTILTKWPQCHDLPTSGI